MSCHCWNTLLPSLWKRSQFTPSPIAGTHAAIPGWSRIWNLDLKSHHLALSIAKKTLDENRFKHAQKTTDHTHLIIKLVTEYILNQATWKWHLKWRACYRILHIECNGHYVDIENQATGKTRPCNVKDIVHELPVELWNVSTKFGRAGKFINQPANLPTIPLCPNKNNITYNHI